jgi:hypothetical protein
MRRDKANRPEQRQWVERSRDTVEKRCVRFDAAANAVVAAVIVFQAERTQRSDPVGPALVETMSVRPPFISRR